VAAIPGAEVHRSFDLDPERLAALAAAARGRTGRELPRLDLFVRLRVPGDVDVEALLAELRADPEIELAADVSEPILPAVTPDYTPLQAYLDPAPVGLDALRSHAFPGGAGAGIGVCAIEFGFNPLHEDLPPVEVIYDPSHDLSQNADHGTAVLGEMAALGNGVGCTGVALDARFYFASITGGLLPAAFGRALEVLRPGDVINVSLQYSDKGPVEYVPDVFAAVELAVAAGISVVEAAGNFATDLDTATNALGQRIWDPASPQYRDSGAVLAGAGVPTGDKDPHSKLMLSAYGRRVNCQGWGRSVVTCGFGDLHDGGPDARYTATFGATSACAPMLAGAIACLQGVLRAAGGSALPPEAVRALLADPANGTPQASSPLFPAESFHIGPLPDLARVLAKVLPAESAGEAEAVAAGRENRKAGEEV
jgi:hypothetical protein